MTFIEAILFNAKILIVLSSEHITEKGTSKELIFRCDTNYKP